MDQAKQTLPTRRKCYRLFEKYGTPQNVIKHCELVSKVAVYLASKLKDAGLLINTDLVERASLLHDIARLSDQHAKRGAEIVSKEGYPALAEIIRKHRYDVIGERGLQTWEEKIVYYADKRAVYDILSIKERVKRWMRKYPRHKEEIKCNLPLVHELEEEIFSKLEIKPTQLKDAIS